MKSPAPSPPSRAARGFTLVELLVVVVIISILMGLLLPAIVGARARARIAQCTNNQKELGSAILQYELAKKRLPGYANRIANTITASWVPVLFPYLGRMDLWEGANGWRSGDSTTNVVYIKQLICPDMPATGPALTYVVNVGVGSNTGLFRDLTATSSISLSDVKSPSRQPMISELAAPADRRWDEIDSAVTAVQFGFPWPENLAAAGVPVTDMLPPIHPGIVIITFCDGRVESVADDTLCSVYAFQSFP